MDGPTADRVLEYHLRHTPWWPARRPSVWLVPAGDTLRLETARG